MNRLPWTNHVLRLSKEMAPALLVLFFTIFFSFFFGYFTFARGWEAIYRVLIRFLRFTLSLCLPLYILLPVYGFVLSKLKRVLIQTGKKQEPLVDPVKHWLFRPFQGIGIGFLFGLKLLTTLQVITGIPVKPFFLFPVAQFQPLRLLLSSGVTMVISLLLSTLWTLDDMGIRHMNRKDQEVKMIGKYVGTLMPIIFGFYGILRLVANFPKVQAFIYLFKIIAILYPSFMIFAVLHTQFVKNRVESFSRKASLERIGIWHILLDKPR